MTEIKIDNDAIAGLVADKLADDFNVGEMVRERLSNKLGERIDAELNNIGHTMIDDAIKRVTENWRDIKLRRTDNWGHEEGDPISLPNWCEEQIAARVYGGDFKLAEPLKKQLANIVETHVKSVIAKHVADIDKAVLEGISQGVIARISTVKVR